jgi:hypothetical protein
MQGSGLISRLTAWAAQPFSEQMDIWNWVLLTMLVVTVSFAWSRVMRHITDGE